MSPLRLEDFRLERVGKKRFRKARNPRHMLQEGNERRTKFLACYYFRPSDNQHRVTREYDHELANSVMFPKHEATEI